MTYLWIGIGVIVALIVLAFNSLAQLRNIVANAWADIDVFLKRRADLIPNLVETTKAYSGFERDTLESVTQARSEALSAGSRPAARAEAENRLATRVHQIIAIAENYPELKASTQYLRLQEELAEAEDKISYARQYYNAAVRDLNTTIDRFPQNLVAGAFGFKRAEFFSLDEPHQRETPRANLSQ
ncbi:MAG: LemA family protein [Fimbriimonadales bacterium]